jgi:hypothetical protein
MILIGIDYQKVESFEVIVKFINIRIEHFGYCTLNFLETAFDNEICIVSGAKKKTTNGWNKKISSKNDIQPAQYGGHRDPYKLFYFPDTVYLGKLFSNQEEKKLILAPEKSKDIDLVNHPDHYNKEGRKECWDEMIEIFGYEAVAIFDILSAYKYYYRAGSKEGNSKEQDLAKINNYMRHSAEMIINNIYIIELIGSEDVKRIKNIVTNWTIMNEQLKEMSKNNVTEERFG